MCMNVRNPRLANFNGAFDVIIITTCRNCGPVLTSMMSFLVFFRALAMNSASDESALRRLNVSNVLSGTPV